MEQSKKIIYYKDELRDDFSGFHKDAIQITEDFPFIHKNPLWRMLSFIVYRIIMTPFAFIYCKCKYKLKIVKLTTEKIKKGAGCFLYANHTLADGDAFIPPQLMFPRRVYPIVNPENISTPGTKNFILMNGAIPIPQSVGAFRGFLNAVEKRILQGHCVAVYPEAHIWPYYTDIRPFSAKAFKYPVKYNAPVYASTTTFQENPRGGRPRVTVYLAGPFYPDTQLPPRQAQQKLRDTVYAVMCRNAKHSTCKYIEYRKETAEV